MRINGKAAGAIVAAGLAMSQPATAWAGDYAGFLGQVRSEIAPGSIFVGDYALMDFGNQVCDMVRGGVSWPVLENDSRQVNRLVARAARAHLCPDLG